MAQLGYDANPDKAQIQLIGFQMAGDHKILVDASDTIAGYLADKIKQGANVTLTLKNPGGNEYLEVDIGSGVATKTYADTAASDAADAAEAAANAYTDSKLPDATRGASILGKTDGTYEVVNFAVDDINTDASQAPTVADGQIFYVDATNLTVDRNIILSATGATERQAVIFKVVVPTSGTGKKYILVEDVTLNLSSKMIVVCIFKSGAWQIASWNPYT